MKQTFSESRKLLPEQASPSRSGQENAFPQFDQNQNTVQVYEKWWGHCHLKYLLTQSGEMIILELDGEPPPFVLMESGRAITVGNAADSR